MFCPNCGAQVDDDARCCPSCGAQMSGGPTVPGGDGPSPIVPAPMTAVGAISVRNFWVDLVLLFVTCGFYAFYLYYALARDMNRMCQGDGENTTGILGYTVLSVVTCGLYSFWWSYKLGNRLQANAPRYGLSFQENGTTLLLWQILGAFICGVGPFIALYLVIKNFNALAMSYNARMCVR